MDSTTNKGAEFSDCKNYRYRLWRVWDESKPHVLFIMLNPSTADEDKNDPTVERCERFARAWGCGGLRVCNLFAFRATNPADMKAASDPIGISNDDIIISEAKKAGMVICAWGNHGDHLKRSITVRALLNQHSITTHYLSLTGKYEPGHPLYLKKALRPQVLDIAA